MNILLFSLGSDIEHALRLARDGHKVKIFTPWCKSAAEFADYAPGLGYEKQGVTKSLYFWEDVKWADLICFFDVGSGDVCSHLKENTKKAIFGAGLKGEQLEENRWDAKVIEKKLGINFMPTERIIGIKKLREYLSKNPNKHVKTNIFRGDMESFTAKNLSGVETYLDALQVKLGPFSDDYEFLVEDHKDGLEMGWDLFFNGNDWIKPYLWGSSGSTFSYVGKYSDTMPASLQDIADRLKPYLREIDYRGAMSIEVIVDKTGKAYLLDICSRYPIPMCNLYTECIKNYTELITAVANKKPVTIQPVAKYVSCLALSSEYGEKHWVELSFNDKMKSVIKTRISVKRGDKYYSVSGTQIVYVILGWGNTITEAIKKNKDVLKEVDAFQLDKNSVQDLDKIEEILLQTKEYKMGEF